MILSLLIFSPLIGLLIILLSKNKNIVFHKVITLLLVGLQSVLGIYAYFMATEEWIIKLPWIHFELGNWGVFVADYHIGMDGMNTTFILLSAVVLLIACLAAWKIQYRTKAFFSLYLLLCTSVFGCFLALDFFLFYVFFEFILLPMYFLIGIWGGKKRSYAAIKFFIYTLVGSLLILVVMIGLNHSTINTYETAVRSSLPHHPIERFHDNPIKKNDQIKTLDFYELANTKNILEDSVLHPNHKGKLWGKSIRWWAFLALTIGFLIKLPAVPFHTWLPSAHVEAPTSISIVLAGILLKVGGYGLLRVGLGIFPDVAGELSWALGLLGVISILYGAMNAIAMNNFKRMIAYASVSHMGFVLLGIASLTQEGIEGASYQMFSHGILSAMLFFIVGILDERTSYKQIDGYSGLVHRMPLYTCFVVVAFFASLGLPAFSGFIGEFMTLLGAFSSPYLPKWMTVLATLGIVLSAVFFLWTLQRMFFGSFWVKEKQWEVMLKDTYPREYLILGLLALLSLSFGLFPNLLLNKIDFSMLRF